MTTMTTLTTEVDAPDSIGALKILTLPHPQGCRTYILADPASRQAMAIDVHLDFVDEVAERVRKEGWTLPYVVDTHTHADHPSGSAAIAARSSSTRIAHESAHHAGVNRHPADGDTLHLGDVAVTVRHAPGHTPDHIMLLADGGVFCGDTVLIGGVARTDFLGGDAGQLFDSIHRVLDELPDETVVFPGHDYQGRMRTTLGDERRDNAWLKMSDRDDFVRQLSANPPPRPANMDDLLRLNREGVEIPASVSAAEAARLIAAGGATSVIDVRTGAEFDGENIKGSRLIPLDQITQRADEVRATPAPRLLLCRVGNRAEMARQALVKLHIGGLTVVEGGIEAYRTAGGATEVGKGGLSLERQVRIGAGAMALTGVVLGFLVHPLFFWLSGFVGVGLMIAGIFDWCGMGLLLAKAPWNKSTSAGASGPAAACAAAPPSCSAGVPSACAAPAPSPKSKS
jgi:glyoxylase-like metal-dependent hydrolase (beta-lactamase superfamily II)